MAADSIFPEWWSWELSFTGHAELRMVQRSVTEVDPWIVIVEPDVETEILVVVTAYEVSP